MPDLKFSQRWKFNSMSSELWRRVVLRYDTNVSEDHTASIVKVKMEAAWSSDLCYSNATLHSVTSEKTLTWNFMKLRRSWEITQLVKKFPACYGIRRFITMFTRLKLVPILGQMNPVHNFPPYLYKIHWVISLPSTPRSSVSSLPLDFSAKIFLSFSHLSHACCLPRPPPPPWFDRTNNVFETCEIVTAAAINFNLWFVSHISLFHKQTTMFVSQHFCRLQTLRTEGKYYSSLCSKIFPLLHLYATVYVITYMA
jgi:hypothetical protein